MFCQLLKLTTFYLLLISQSHIHNHLESRPRKQMYPQRLPKDAKHSAPAPIKQTSMVHGTNNLHWRRLEGLGLTKSYLKTNASSSKNLNTEHYFRTGKKAICTSSWIKSLPSYTFSHSRYKGNDFAWNFLSLGWSWQMQTKVSSIVTS